MSHTLLKVAALRSNALMCPHYKSITGISDLMPVNSVQLMDSCRNAVLEFGHRINGAARPDFAFKVTPEKEVARIEIR